METELSRDIEQADMSTTYILIVDDNLNSSQLLAKYLVQHGYCVNIASDSLTASRLIDARLPDLIILDILMPVVDGYEVCQTLKADERTRHIPVIFISALEQLPDKVKAFSVGGADFITKPFQFQEVLVRIKHQLQLVQLQQELQQQRQQLIEQNQQLQQEIKERERALYERQQAEVKLTQERTFLDLISTRFSTLISNLQEGILVENESRQIVLVNQPFCDLLGISASPKQLIGTDCAQAFEQTKPLFIDPESFTERIQDILHQRQHVIAEEIWLVNGRIVERDYIPIFQRQQYQGHLWHYRDITTRKAAELELHKKTRTLTDFSVSLKHLHRLSMTDFESLEALFADYIQTGCTVLGFSAGAIGYIHEQTYTFLAVQSEFEHLVPNLTINLQDAYCGKVVECQATVSFHHVGEIGEMQYHPLYQMLKLESYLGTPILVNGELFGTLCFFSTQARPQGFDNHEREIVELMAQSIGKFLNTQQIKAKQQQAEEEVRLLLTLTQEIAAASDFDQALEIALQTLCEATGWIYGEVWLPSTDKTVLECSPIWYCNRNRKTPAAIAQVEQFRHIIAGTTLQRGEGIAGRVWKSQQAEWMPDVEDFLKNPSAVTPLNEPRLLSNTFGLNAHFGVPIVIARDHNSTYPEDSVYPEASPTSAASSQSTVLAILVFFIAASCPQDERLTRLVSAVAAQLGIILAQKQTENALRESEERFRTIFEQAAIGIGLATTSGQIIRVNQGFCDLLGYTESELLSKTFQEVTYPDDLEHSLIHIHQALAGEIQTFSLEKRYVCKSGSLRWVNLTASLVRDTAGVPQHFLSIIEDIQDRKEVEAALRQAKEAAVHEAARSADANRIKSEFLANMSHELRTPLNAILGFTQLMARESSLNQTAHEYLNIISRSGEYLLNLINDVLEVSKIEAGQLLLNSSCFNLYSLLQNLEEMFQLKAESKGLQLIFNCESSVPECVETDEGKLHQVLINLLGNAIKFTQIGSVRLTVTALSSDSSHETCQGLEQIANGETQVMLLFKVEDTGSGIAPDELDNLFEPFVQSKSGQNHEGTGLGLPISRKFVQLMGGDISVSSTLNQGTSVQFNIQVHLAESGYIRMQRPKRRAITLAPGQAAYRILVVEDHLESRQLLLNLLQSIGFEVQEATDGATAIAIWQTWQPHLIWMDMRMPVMNGFEATRQIRAQESSVTVQSEPSTSEPLTNDKREITKIIALTASAFEEERAKVIAAGCNDFVRKPFQEAIILEKIVEHLGVQYIYEEDEIKNTWSDYSKEWISKPNFLSFHSLGRRRSLLSRQGRSKLQPSSLSIMPAEWIQQVHEAAILGSDRQLLQLIKQIPETHASLANTLTDWVSDFQFEHLLTLTQPYCR